MAFSLLTSPPAQAGIFGDSIEGNGHEDGRLSRDQAEHWPKEFRAVGRLICNEQVQGSAVLLAFDNRDAPVSAREITPAKPVILTARHVLEGSKLEDCYFAPESYQWHRAAILLAYSADQSFSDTGDTNNAEEPESIILKYTQDWLLLDLEPWPNWQENALAFHNNKKWSSAVFANQDKGKYSVSYMVGFDLLRNQIVADYHCRSGLSEQTSLLIDNNLLWDSCDSAKGSSGGALFVEHDGELFLAGIRVGTLFDSNQFEGEPKIGDRFDLNAYINVSRKVPF